MNATQIRYAKERADTIKRARITAVNACYAAVELDPKEKHAAFLAGEYKVKKFTKGGGRMYYISDLLEFNAEKPRDNEAHAKAVAAVEKEHRELVDALVLGDAEEALAMLKKFAGES